jgi:hypothetical protein
MNAEQMTRIEISTECNCVEFDEDDNETQASECWGYEYQESIEYLRGELLHWLKANEWTDETIIRVQFSGVSWRRVAGYTDITVADIPEFLTLNGDFRIVFDLTADYQTLTACRYSHDEPTGTGLITFTRSPFSRCDYCGDVSECSPLDGQQICQHCKEWNAE